MGDEVTLVARVCDRLRVDIDLYYGQYIAYDKAVEMSCNNDALFVRR